MPNKFTEGRVNMKFFYFSLECQDYFLIIIVAYKSTFAYKQFL